MRFFFLEAFFQRKRFFLVELELVDRMILYIEGQRTRDDEIRRACYARPKTTERIKRINRWNWNSLQYFKHTSPVLSLSASSQFNRALDVSTTNQSRSFSSALAVIDESSYLPPLRVVGRRIFSSRKIYLYAFQCENILRGFWKQRDGTPRASQRQVDIWGLFIFCRAPNGDTSHLLRASIHT